ncbi:MAG TPA: ABC transporter substrate-binding protein [Lachnospiraceae bacterium]|nr:ABC transporter substrate-binding protein [Lachnospiraceae bacterium]
MKRKSLSKVLALALASAMALGLAACGNGDGGNSSAPASDSGNESSSETGGSDAGTSSEAGGEESSEDAGGQQASGERQTISFSVIDLNAGANNIGDYAEQIMNQIQDYTNVNIELTWVANDALKDKNALYLTNPKTMPHIISWGGTMEGNVVDAAKQGAFVNLNDYIWDSEKYPNLSGMDEKVAASLTVDGKLIAIPRTRVVGRYGMSYRTDWFEKLKDEYNLTEPNTPEAVYDMLYAFTYGDPDGNGQDDTIGMEMTSYTGPFDIIQIWFGCGNGWAEVDGQLVPVWMQPEYMEAADYIKKIYDDGLMPKDWVSRPTDDWSNGCKKGENGVFIDVLDSGKRIWKYFEDETTRVASVVNPDEDAHMTMYGAVNGRTMATAGYNGFFTLSATTLDTPEKIEAALTLLDKLNDPEMLTITQYGLEGINYQMEDGLLVQLDNTEEMKALAQNYKGLNQMLAFLPTTEACTEKVPRKIDKYDEAQNEAYEKALQYAIINPALPYTVNSPAYSANGKTLDDEAAAARSQYICGEITKEQFQEVLDGIRTRGYDDIIAEVNEQYKANQ